MIIPRLVISAYGIPQVQGNHRVARTGKFSKIRDANENLPGWRLLVSTLAREAFDGDMILDPVQLEVNFWIARPKSAPKTRDVRPVTRGGGDWDKLSRAIGDSLVDAGVMKDDSQIVEARISKRYAVTRDLPIYRAGFHWEQPGAFIVVKELDAG
ncbi:RusA-like resolvase [Microbacterium phage Fregley]|nr:RusA-like resolvase [Microbacterium phage Fregley]